MRSEKMKTLREISTYMIEEEMRDKIVSREKCFKAQAFTTMSEEEQQFQRKMNSGSQKDKWCWSIIARAGAWLIPL